MNNYKTISNKEILSFKEAMAYLDVSKSFLYKATSRKKIRFSKPNGGKLYFRKEDLDRWMTQNTQESVEDKMSFLEQSLNKGKHGKL